MTVLIVDDDPGFRRVVRRMLERDAVKRLLHVERGVDVVAEVGDGEEAVRLTRELRPEVVLMDVAMPRLDGLEALRRIKLERPETRVIILTVHDEEAYRRAAAKNGADAFLAKKTLMGELATAIKGSGRQRQREGNPPEAPTSADE